MRHEHILSFSAFASRPPFLLMSNGVPIIFFMVFLCGMGWFLPNCREDDW